MGGSTGFDWQQYTASPSAYGHPKKPTNLVKGSGIYPLVSYTNWTSQPQCSPPGEFIPRWRFLKEFKNKETCFEYYRRLHALGWSASPLGVGARLPLNPNVRMFACIAAVLGFALTTTQLWYSHAMHYPKTYTQDWAEAEVLHPRLQRSHLQRFDYQPCANLGTFDVRWPRWAKLEN